MMRDGRVRTRLAKKIGFGDSSLASRIFSAALADSADVSRSSRLSRRSLINTDLLKSSKVFAGDVVQVRYRKCEFDPARKHVGKWRMVVLERKPFS